MATSRLPSWVLIAGLASLMVACQREPSALRRPWAPAELESVTFQNTTMRARRLASAPRVHTLDLGPARPGTLRFDAAVEGAEGARATFELVDAPADTTCVVRAASWQACHFTLTRPVAALTLRVRLEGPEDARVSVSSPFLSSGPPSRSVVIVILADTLRFDRLTTYAPHVPLGAALDRLAQDGVVFERAYSSSSWTRTAVATLLTGLDAGTHNVLGRDDMLPGDLDGLPLAMQRAGYRTIVWSTNPNILPLWGFDAGVDVFHDVGAREWPREKAHAASVLGAVRASLANDDPLPAYLYVHLMDPHAPYRPQPADLEAVRRDSDLMATFPGQTSPPNMVDQYAHYLAEIRGMDRDLGTFFDALAARGLYDGATILVLADHGEEFLDHGGARHGSTLYEEVLRIPVLLKLPGNALAGTRLASTIGLADIGPTLLGALGIAGLPDADGRNLWSSEQRAFRDEPAPQSAVLKLDTHHQAALVADARKLILDYRASDQLFDLVRDPQERRNLLPNAPADGLAMRAVLDARIARHEAGWHVRICGGDRAERQRIRVEVHGEARGALLEAGDAVRLIDRRGVASDYEAELELMPRPSERLVNGRLWRGMRADEDEIVAPSIDSDIRVTAPTAGEPLRWASGTAAARVAAAEFKGQASDPATRIRPSDAIDCRALPTDGDAEPAEDPASYVRVWYVPPADRVDDTTIDPALQERLRALGYQR